MEIILSAHFINEDTLEDLLKDYKDTTFKGDPSLKLEIGNVLITMVINDIDLDDPRWGTRLQSEYLVTLDHFTSTWDIIHDGHDTESFALITSKTK